MGVRLNPSVNRPEDPYTKERQKVSWNTAILSYEILDYSAKIINVLI